ncbi:MULTISPECIES: putative metallopeptidase [unclassified Ensifer]|uniref:putative metallopeptidase n=1 Tax=unclassified Ensifer TaxID=2633371 RepID=UPI00300FADEC
MRPQPPSTMFDDNTSPAFTTAEDMPDWVDAMFLDPSSPVHNPDHLHLSFADIGYLWTTVGNSKKGRRVIGQCETGSPQGTMGKWSRARVEIGQIPDFIIAGR